MPTKSSCVFGFWSGMSEELEAFPTVSEKVFAGNWVYCSPPLGRVRRGIEVEKYFYLLEVASTLSR
jgi:hypothetical protein